MNLSRAADDDLMTVRALLTDAQLPYTNITQAKLQHFIVLRNDVGVCALVGLEQHGAFALLRSLVVAPEFRSRGYGVKLTKAAEALSEEIGATALYLLTTTAEGFLRSPGFRRITREGVPKEIRETTEFSSLCPSGAVVMVKP